jgi:hypothetical protein
LVISKPKALIGVSKVKIIVLEIGRSVGTTPSECVPSVELKLVCSTRFPMSPVYATVNDPKSTVEAEKNVSKLSNPERLPEAASKEARSE